MISLSIQAQQLFHELVDCPERFMSGLNRQSGVSKLTITIPSITCELKDICELCLSRIQCQIESSHDNWAFVLSFINQKDCVPLLENPSFQKILSSSVIQNLRLVFQRYTIKNISLIITRLSSLVPEIEQLAIKITNSNKEKPFRFLSSLSRFTKLKSFSLILDQPNLEPLQLHLLSSKDIINIPSNLKELEIEYKNNVASTDNLNRLFQNFASRITPNLEKLSIISNRITSENTQIFKSLSDSLCHTTQLQELDLKLDFIRLQDDFLDLLQNVMNHSLINLSLQLNSSSIELPQVNRILQIIKQSKAPLKKLNIDLADQIIIMIFVKQIHDFAEFQKNFFDIISNFADSLESLGINLKNLAQQKMHDIYNQYQPTMFTDFLPEKQCANLTHFKFQDCRYSGVIQKEQESTPIQEEQNLKYQNMMKFLILNPQLIVIEYGEFRPSEYFFSSFSDALKKQHSLRELTLRPSGAFFDYGYKFDECLPVYFDGLSHLNLKKVRIESINLPYFQEFLKYDNIEELTIGKGKDSKIQFGTFIPSIQVKKLIVNSEAVSFPITAETSWDNFKCQIIIFNYQSTIYEFVPCYVRNKFIFQEIQSLYLSFSATFLAFKRSIDADLLYNPKAILYDLYF